MKTILFRGKTTEGEWVYGSLILAGDYCCILESEKDSHPMDYPYLDGVLGTIDGKATPVIPETVGRLIEHPCYDYTNQRFFEGDIVEIYNRHCNIEYAKPASIAIVVNEHCITENGRGRWFPQDTIQVKVIGNVHDTPDLVGKKYADLFKFYFGFNTSVTQEDLRANMKEE